MDENKFRSILAAVQDYVYENYDGLEDVQPSEGYWLEDEKETAKYDDGAVLSLRTISAGSVENCALPDVNIPPKGASFAELLEFFVKEKEISHAECQKLSTLSRQLYSKIKLGAKPSKPTACALALALELNLDETDEFLRSAGMALSPSIIFDMVIEALIDGGIYDVEIANEILKSYNEKPISEY